MYLSSIKLPRFHSPVVSSSPKKPRIRHARKNRPSHRLRAASEDLPSDDDFSLSDSRDRLEGLMSANTITGAELKQLVFDKWNRTYEVRLQRRGQRMYLHIMWRYLEQQSFAMTEYEYNIQLDAVAEYLNMWNVADIVRIGIKKGNRRGPGISAGGAGVPISIPLGVDVGGLGRSDEWAQ